jgi:hypothetical protein
LSLVGAFDWVFSGFSVVFWFRCGFGVLFWLFFNVFEGLVGVVVAGKIFCGFARWMVELLCFFLAVWLGTNQCKIQPSTTHLTRECISIKFRLLHLQIQLYQYAQASNGHSLS